MEWVEQLPERVQVSLDTLLEDVDNHEDVYMEAQNVSVGQIWVAMALMNERIRKLEDMVSAQRKALNEENVEVDKHLDQKLKESLKRY